MYTAATGTGWAGEVEKFVAANAVGDIPADLSERFAFLIDYQRRVHEAGLAVVSWPQEYGGRGASAVEAMAVSEAFGRAHAPELINFVAIEVVAPALMAYAAPGQLARWLPPMASAAEVWCQLFSEPDAGSDLGSLRTRAEFDGEKWRVTGSKIWSTWAQFADRGLLLARHSGPETRHKGIGAFVIDMHQPGVDVRPLETMTGSAEFAQVFLDSAIVSAADAVGQPDQGWDVTLRTLESERGPYALRRAAVLASGLTRLHERARRSWLSDHERSRVVDATLAMHVLRARADEVAERLATAQPLAAESALTKIALTDAEQAIFEVAHELLGADGDAWLDEPEEIELYLYSRAASIYGGSAQIQRNILAERYLGLRNL